MSSGKHSSELLNLVDILATLNEIGARISRLGMGDDLRTTLQLVVEGAVQAVSAGVPPGTPHASAVIWMYDEASRTFVPDSRVSAGEPEHASTDDFPRPDGLGWRTIQYRRRLISYEQVGVDIHPAKRSAGAQVLVCTPLMVGGEIVGLLYVYRLEDRPFDEVELLALDNFANLAAMAIYHGRKVGGLSRELARRVSELEKLERASQMLSSCSNLEQILQEILSIGLDITAAQYGSFELYDPAQGMLTIRALAGRKGDQPDVGRPLPLDERSVVGWVAVNKKSLLIADLHDPHWRAIYQPLPADREMRSELAVPLIGPGGRVEGVLNLESPLPNAFTPADCRLLETLAAQAVVAIQEIRLLDVIHEIGEMLLTADEDQLFELIVDRACRLMNMPVGAIWTLAEDDMLVLRQSPPGYRRADRLPLDSSLTGLAVRLRRPITVDDLRQHPAFHRRDLAVAQNWVSAIIVPLLVPGKAGPLGCFSLYADHLRDFSAWDKKLLTILANQAAIAIQTARGVARLKAHNLSEREEEVLALLIQGYTNKQIAEVLTVTVNTVKKHVQSIFTKLNVDNRAAAVAKALQDMDR